MTIAGKGLTMVLYYYVLQSFSSLALSSWYGVLYQIWFDMEIIKISGHLLFPKIKTMVQHSSRHYRVLEPDQSFWEN
jgi:hypothetical protein